MSRLQQRIENFNKAFKLLHVSVNEYSKNKESDINKLALTQAFEIASELGWKVIKDYLTSKQIEVFTPKDVIKKAFSINILPSAQIWIDMINDRNACSHEYNQDKVNIILNNITNIYFNELMQFSNLIKEFHD